MDFIQPFVALFEHVSDGIALARPSPWRLVFQNSEFARLAGGSAGCTDGWPLEELMSRFPADALLEGLDHVWRGEESCDVVAGETHHDQHGSSRPVEIRLVSVTLADERLIGLVVRKQDAASAKTTAGRRDPLTGLSDRSELLVRLEMLLGGDRTADQLFAVLFIDLNDFKEVNDRYGHLIGDRALADVARRLVRCTRTSDQVFRYGGDEFVVLVDRVAGENEIEPVVARIHAELAQPLTMPDGEVQLAVSIGVAEVSSAHRTAEDVLSDADRAMYVAKRLAARART